MKKILLLMCAFVASLTAGAQDTNLSAEDGVTAKVGDTDVSNVLNATGAQPNSYDTNDEMNVVIDLQSSKSIDGFALTFYGDRWVSEFTLSYSTDGSEYTKIADYETGRVAQNPETNIAQTFTSAVTARFIKYTSKKSNKNVNDQWSESIRNFRLLQFGAIPSIPAIVSDSHLLGIFSFDLGNAPGYGWQDWGSSTIREEVPIRGKNTIKFSNYTYYGSGFDKIDATTYAKLHIDVYASFTGTLAIFPITGTAEKGLQFNVTANSWTSKDFDIADFVDLGLNMANMYQIKYVDHVDANNSPVNGDGSHTFIIGNVYLYGTPVVDTQKPVMETVTVASTTHRTATLTVKASDDNTYGTLTYTVKNSNDETVGTGAGVQGEDVSVIINGLTASTSYSEGEFKVSATDRAGNVSSEMKVPAFSTAAAPSGQVYTNGTYEILVQARHYINTFDYELIISSEETMTGFSSGAYWKLNGNPGGTTMNSAEITLSDGGKTMTVKVRSTSAPVMDTPLYIMMPSEIAFKESDESYPKFDWIEVAGAKTYDVMVSGDEAAVIGTISASNLSEFQAAVGNASFIDVKDASIAGDIDELTTNNANAIFVYKDLDAAAAATKTVNSAYKADVRFYGVPNGLTFVDDPANVPLLPTKAYSAIGSGKSVDINRTIAANSYVTTYMGANVGVMTATLETGLDAYELSAAEAGQLTFTKVASIAPGKGYVIHNATSNGLNLKWQTTGIEVYLDESNQSADAVEAIDGVKILGTLKTVTTNGTEDYWVLSGNQIKEAAGVTITPYRAYFTGVTAPSTSSAIAIFNDGETTKIATINAEGEIHDAEVYDLNGHRVQNPTKGLYIVNGKKVVIK